MISLRLVLDTNIFVSAVIKPSGFQRTLLLLATMKPVHWYVSQSILDEYSSVLARPRFRIPKGVRQQFLQLAKRHARVIVPSRLPQITGDLSDNKFLECADAARADYLITGNTRDFPSFWKMTKIVNSREFLSIVTPHLIP